jgi:hypothetical protein
MYVTHEQYVMRSEDVHRWTCGTESKDMHNRWTCGMGSEDADRHVVWEVL